MERNFRRTAILVTLALLVMAPLLAGCGGGEAEGRTVVVGWLTDQTGPSAQTFKEVSWGMEDFLKDMEPIPGVNIKVISYDTRLEYARVPQGYEWLVEQGTSLMLQYSPAIAQLVINEAARDQVPSLGLSNDTPLMTADYMYGFPLDLPREGQFLMEYLIRDWWETRGMTRPIKVGALFPSGLLSADQYWGAFQAVASANPGKCELSRQQGATSQTAWASEVTALKDCDAIVVASPGPASPTFMKEARSRGFAGQFVGTTISVLGAWTLVRGLATPEELDGTIIPHSWHLWTDDSPFVTQMKSALEKYRPDEKETLMRGSTWLTAWTFGYIVSEIVRLAADNVGPDQVDKAAILDAIEELSLEIDGLPTLTLANSGGNHVLQPCLKMARYDGAQDQWYGVSDWVNMLSPGS